MSYTTLQAARRQLAVDLTVDNAILADYLPLATQAIEDLTGHWFEPHIATFGFDGEVGNATLNLRDRPLLESTALLNGNGASVDTANYTLLPVGQYPKERVRLNRGYYWLAPSQTSVLCAPLVDAAYAEDAIQLTGIWGFHRNYASAWRDTGLTVSGAHTAATETLTTSASVSTQFDIGNMLKIVNASTGALIEFLNVSGLTTPATSVATVERAYNGSTATALTGGEKIYVWKMEPLIEWAAREVVSAAYVSRQNATGEQANVGGFGSVTITDIPRKVRGKLYQSPYFSHYRGNRIDAE